MSHDKPKLSDPVPGYSVLLIYTGTEIHRQLKEVDLRVDRVGGSHIRNGEAIITQLEDAIFLDLKE